MSERNTVVAMFASAAMLVLSSSLVYALGGKIDSPSHVSFSVTYPEKAREQVQKALQTKSCKFIGGRFVNWNSTLDFSGESTAFCEMTQKLSECPETTVAISFRKLDDECDWRLQHDGQSNRFHFIVNVNSKRIDFGRLDLPEIKGPKLEGK